MIYCDYVCSLKQLNLPFCVMCVFRQLSWQNDVGLNNIWHLVKATIQVSFVISFNQTRMRGAQLKHQDVGKWDAHFMGHVILRRPYVGRFGVLKQPRFETMSPPHMQHVHTTINQWGKVLKLLNELVLKHMFHKMCSYLCQGVDVFHCVYAVLIYSAASQ